jgi:hypothetical protein
VHGDAERLGERRRRHVEVADRKQWRAGIFTYSA